MFSGQNILVIGALAILSVLIITFYNNEGSKYTMTLDNEAVIAATGLGQTVIEKLSNKPFDENTLGRYVDMPDSLTLPDSLGPESNETDILMYDDFDDFHNYSETDSLMRLGYFKIRVNIDYVFKHNPDSAVDVRTFYKLATVSVSNPYLRNDLSLHYLASY